MYIFAKRCLDITLTVPAIVLLSPFLLIVVVCIRLTSPGPAIFRQSRAGLGGRAFMLYKFRTMRTDVDPFGASPKSADDGRLTPLGRCLREYSIDELPQLFNVFSGDMTLVGPRPLYVAQIAEWNETERQRLLVKPGLTGLAQISGRGQLTREAKLALDVQYVQQKGLWCDLKILLATIAMVFGRKSIYEKKYSQTEHTRDGDEQ